MKSMIVSVFILLTGIASGYVTAFAATASHETSEPAAHPGHSVQALPTALRPALYQALSKDAGPAARIGANGCAVLPKQSLKACFNKQGAHFAGGSSSLALHLAAYGRGGNLSPVAAVQPKIKGNRVSYAHGHLTEWWRVLPVGFEQGFTITKRPIGNGELKLALVAGRLAAGDHAISDSHAVANSTKHEIAWGKLRYGHLVVTDANGKVVPASLSSNANSVLITVNDANAVYPLTVDPLVWIDQRVTWPDGEGGEGESSHIFFLDSNFGVSVAIAGTTAIVSADDVTVNGNQQQGAVYIFSKADGTWSEVTRLTASDGFTYQHLGFSTGGHAVALNEDGTVAVVGALYNDSGGYNQAGAVYVFSNVGGSWTQTAEFSASDPSAFARFGNSVAISGTTVLAGSYLADPNGNSAQGVAYVFSKSGGTWTQTAELIASDGAAGDYFGSSVALSGTAALVGAPIAAVKGNTGQGAAYVFTETNGTWTQTQKLTANDGASSDNFGHSVGLSGTAALVGAPIATVKGNTGQGAAYVFSKSGGTWTQTAKLTASDGAADDNFGYSAALSGTTALVGAWHAMVDGNIERGAAYVFSKSEGAWAQTLKLTASEGGNNFYYGNSVALDGATYLIGSKGFRFTDSHPFYGAVYFYGRSDLGLALSAPQSVGQGQQYISQTIATNNASMASPAVAVAVTVTVPAAASFVSANATQGSCSEASGVVTCDFGQIGGNAGTATANVTLKATGNAGETIENTASVAKATPALTSSAATEITSPGSCPAGYTEFDGHLDAGETFTSAPIEVTEAGQKYVDLTAPASFGFFAITNTRYGQHTYVYPHAKHGHRWGVAGTYQVGVQAGPDSGGDYTLCVNLNPAQ